MSLNNVVEIDDVESLGRAFETCTLARSQWDHAAHLKVALWYLWRYPVADAVRRIRQGIQRYNNAHNNQGYHETLTLFWIRAVQSYLTTADAGADLDQLVPGLLEHCNDKHLTSTYFSRERLFSEEARTQWLEPDLNPLL